MTGKVILLLNKENSYPANERKFYGVKICLEYMLSKPLPYLELPNDIETYVKKRSKQVMTSF